MGNGMNKVLPGLYIGNYRDSKDCQQLDRHKISHIVSIHDSPRRFHPDKHYLCVMAADSPDQNLAQYFPVCNDFIHAARLKEGNVLIHCLAGMSRSVTVAVAYIMSVTQLEWKDALKVVRAGRAVANPNLGFQDQLQEFEQYKVFDERQRLKERFPSIALEDFDKSQCFVALDTYQALLLSKTLCEGHCKFGKDCPTGICRTESKSALRRKGSNASTKKQYSLSSIPSTSSLSVNKNSAQSCPTSPRFSKGKGQQNPRAATPDMDDISPLQRSPSNVSQYKPRSNPAGFYSYTGSAPPSIHGSRTDLSAGASSGGSGSAIYINCNIGSSSTSINKLNVASGGRPRPKTPTPDFPSPKSSPKRSGSKISLR